jgi:hypothetical protein
MAYSTIDKGSKYFNTKLYTGDGTGAKAITGVGFQPDLVWLKTRSTAFHHQLHDRVRGATAGAIYSSLTNAQDSNYPITSFDSDGFTLGNSASLIADSFGSQNFSGTTMCSWNWLASNTSGSSNTAGTISSTVSANTTSGFSIVSYTGNGSSSATVGHGLGVTPALVIIKPRDALSANGHWYVKHKSLASNNNIFLNLTNATTDVSGQSAGGIGNLSSSSTFGFVNGTSNISSVNVSSGTYIAYCFAEVKGYSKFGSYTGNGSNDGTFIYTGFKPAYVMIKVSSNSGDGWFIFDNKRTTYNVMSTFLLANSSAADETNTNRNIDFLSNGFKLRNSDTSLNYSAYTYIYMAFAENPFVSSKGIPTTAR